MEICVGWPAAEGSPTISAPTSENTGGGACAGSVTVTTTATACGEFAAPAAITRTNPEYCPAVSLDASTETVTAGGVNEPPSETPTPGVAISQPSAPENVCTAAFQLN